MRDRDVARSGEQDEAWPRLAAKDGPQLGERVGEVGKDVLGRPLMTRRGPQGARTQQHGVSARAQQPHEKAVRLVAPADLRTRRRFGAESHHPVDRLDEIRVDDPVAESERPVNPRKLIRQWVAREIALEEGLERFYQWSGRELAVARNSARSCGSFS